MHDPLPQVLADARRVFGPAAKVEYGIEDGQSWASAGCLDAGTANELTAWGRRPLERLLVCLRALPDHVDEPAVTAGSRTRSRSSRSSAGSEPAR